MKKIILAFILLATVTSTNAQKKKDTTTTQKPAEYVDKITDSLPLVSIADMNKFLSTIDPKTVTVYELDQLKRAFQALIDIGIKNFASKTRQPKK